MSDDSLVITFTAGLDPNAVYALVNDVRGWWEGDLVGTTDEVGAEFTYRNDPYHVSTQHVAELVPGRRIVWDVVAADLSFATPRDEWRGTVISFDITPDGDGSVVRFTHHGLRPALQCYRDCSSGWGFYVGTVLRERVGGVAVVSGDAVGDM